jgi:hypothetical protein
LDCWPNGVVCAREGLVAADRPDYILRLEGSTTRPGLTVGVICNYHKLGAYCDEKSRLANGREHHYYLAKIFFKQSAIFFAALCLHVIVETSSRLFVIPAY